MFSADIGVLVLQGQTLRNAVLTVVIIPANSVQDINSPSRSGAARRIPMSQVQHDKSTGLSGGLIDGEVTQQLFKMWVRSDDKDMASGVIR